MANLSVPSPGTLILDIFEKYIFRSFFGPGRLRIRVCGVIMLAQKTNTKNETYFPINVQNPFPGLVTLILAIYTTYVFIVCNILVHSFSIC